VRATQIRSLHLGSVAARTLLEFQAKWRRYLCDHNRGQIMSNRRRNPTICR